MRPRLAERHVVRPVAHPAAAEEVRVVPRKQERGFHLGRAGVSGLLRLERAARAPSAQRASCYPSLRDSTREEGLGGSILAREPRGELFVGLGTRVDLIGGGAFGRRRRIRFDPWEGPAVGGVHGPDASTLQPSHGQEARRSGGSTASLTRGRRLRVVVPTPRIIIPRPSAVVARCPVVVVVVGEAAEIERVRHRLPSIALLVVDRLDDRRGRRRSAHVTAASSFRGAAVI